MEFKDLTEDQKAKMLALAKEEGYELSDEQLEAVSGGTSWTSEPI